MRVLSWPQPHRSCSAGGSMRTSRTGRSRCAGFCEGRTRLGLGVAGVSSPSAVSRASSAWAAASCSSAVSKSRESCCGTTSPSSCRTSCGREDRRAGAARRSRRGGARSRRNARPAPARPSCAAPARRRSRRRARPLHVRPCCAARARLQPRARDRGAACAASRVPGGARPASSRRESTRSHRRTEGTSPRQTSAFTGIPSRRVRQRAVDRSRPSSNA